MENIERVEELVKMAVDGDARSFAELYESVYKDLYKAALYTLRNPHDAENVVSDTALDAFVGIGKLRDPKNFRAWIFRILSNKCNRYIREYVKTREMVSEVSFDDVLGVSEAGSDTIKSIEDKSIIEQAFSILSNEEKEIVTMTVYGEMDSNEIASSMNINRNTVRSKYSRALRKMRQFLGGDANDR